MRHESSVNVIRYCCLRNVTSSFSTRHQKSSDSLDHRPLHWLCPCLHRKAHYALHSLSVCLVPRNSKRERCKKCNNIWPSMTTLTFWRPCDASLSSETPMSCVGLTLSLNLLFIICFYHFMVNKDSNHPSTTCTIVHPYNTSVSGAAPPRLYIQHL